jgi:hypothetical protein
MLFGFYSTYDVYNTNEAMNIVHYQQLEIAD